MGQRKAVTNKMAAAYRRGTRPEKSAVLDHDDLGRRHSMAVKKPSDIRRRCSVTAPSRCFTVGDPIEARRGAPGWPWLCRVGYVVASPSSSGVHVGHARVVTRAPARYRAISTNGVSACELS